MAFKSRLAGKKESGFLGFEKRSMLMLALKTALAAGICYWLARLAGLQDGYWGSISAIIVLQSNVGSTVSASRDRLIGTLIGAAFGAAFSLLGTGLWAYLLAVITAMVTCSLLGLKNSSRLAGVTVTILMLVHRTGSNWTLPLHRVLEVLLGIVVALAISTLIFPNRARGRLQDGLAEEYLLLGALFQAVMQGFRASTSQNLQHIWTEVIASSQSNSLLRESARNEPSSGKASLEVLSMLDQYGKEMQDILRALQLAIKTTSESSASDNDYAAQLEPELSSLVANVYRGFEYVAGCIHRWEFNEAPDSLSLEHCVTSLESKMATVRPAGINYPQEEILRAYAVQLHLKQLAHLLRSSRIESARVVAKS